MNQGKYAIIKTKIDACDYQYILEEIKISIRSKKTLLVSPIASYTIVLAFFNKEIKNTLAKFNYLTPDSYWVKSSLNFLYKVKLENRVYGPDLMLKTCNLSEQQKYKVFLYGTTTQTLAKLKGELKKLFPKILIVGSAPSKFAPLTSFETKELTSEIVGKKTDILFIGLGSPLQEKFALKLGEEIKKSRKPMTILTVGAAFDFISKNKLQAPIWVQNTGLEWCFRLIKEPGRLGKRYLMYGPLFILLILKQKAGILLNPTHNIVIKNKTGRRDA